MSNSPKPRLVSLSHRKVPLTPFGCLWIPCSNRFVCLGTASGSGIPGTGIIGVYGTASGEIRDVLTIEKPRAFRCGTFGATSLQHRHLATGDFDGNLHIWNLETPEAPLYSAKAHQEIINCIDGVGGLGIGQGAPEIVTGSRDGYACTQWDRCVCAGYDNGDIKLFDLRNMEVRWERNVKSGVCCVEFDGKDTSLNKLVVTTLEGRVHVFDMQKFNTNKGLSCRSEKPYKFTAWTVRHLPQNRSIFVTSGGAGSLHLWKHGDSSTLFERTDHEREDKDSTSPTLLNSISLSSQPIGSLDWNTDKQGLCISASFDHKVHIVIVADQQGF
ncbi:dynein axonemal assembly factor 10-like isoform X2 [Pristis pectinata]|uniref:dynein axonemal assembly factor 10-like isoform X2 n=1 Tax=Pristis pectinata TaxID=685728 RepID=UPI00223E707B|nr:dynein axonemal assembly factor 10-like isoform X2 [Pristis pectinata]